jgi:hypothetical protein
MKSELCGQGPGGYVVRAAEGGQEVVESVLVEDVDAGQSQAPFVLVAVEKVVLTDGGVEEIARLRGTIGQFLPTTASRCSFVPLAVQALRSEAPIGKPSKEKSKCAPKKQLHLQSGDSELPHQRHRKPRRNLVEFRKEMGHRGYDN